MHNSRGNGSSRYDTQSTSSGSYDRWHDDSDWSSRNETWRGSSNRSPRSSAPSSSDHRHRVDSWKEETYKYGFRLGTDRAPMPVDDQFLVRYGAKRLPNGNLVDRDGYTLRVRDPDCRAPSPPRHNPGRDTRRAEIRSGSARREELNRMSKADIDRKARQQMELVKEMAEKAEDESLNGDNKRRDKTKRKPSSSASSLLNGISEGGVKRISNDVEEGEDEYEEDDDVPPAKKAMTSENGASSSVSPVSAAYANNIKKALLMAPRFAKRTLLPAGPPTSSSSQAPAAAAAALKAGSPNDSTQKSWFRQYQDHVAELKEKVYRPPSFGPGAPPPPPPSTGYFFQSPPPPSSSSSQPACGPFGAPLPIHQKTTPSSTSSSSPYCPSGTPVTYGTPFGEIYNHPPTAGAVPLQMALPPPGVVGFEAPSRDSGAFSGPSRGASGPFPTSPAYSEAYLTSSAPPAPSASSYLGTFGEPGGQMTSATTSSGVRTNASYGITGQASDSDEEDEAILKLREIIRNCGSSARR